MSRKANIDKALKVGLDMHTERGPLVYQEALLESVNLAYDLGIQEGLRLAERRLLEVGVPPELKNRWQLWFRCWKSVRDGIVAQRKKLREARKRKGKK